MILLVLSIILIGLVGLERYISTKKINRLNGVRLFIGLMAIFLIFLISYFVTDTAIGIFYVSVTMIMYFLIGFITYRSNIAWLEYPTYIIGIPLMIFLLIKATENMLIAMNYLVFLMIILNLIISNSYKRKSTLKQNISLGVGIVISLGLLLAYYKFPEPKNRIMLKQEIVALKFLEEELDMDGFEAYVRNINISLRGEEKIVRAYDSTGIAIELIYKDNKIIDWTKSEDPREYYENVEGGSYRLEVTPENVAEETAVNYFSYSFSKDYDGLSEILADTADNRILIEKQKENYKEGIYIKDYTIQSISTLPKNGYSNENHIFFYSGWEEIVDKYELIEYEIVRVKFLQIHSKKANELIPQWGDGTYYRSFIVGKSSDDKDYRIYDFGMMEEIWTKS